MMLKNLLIVTAWLLVSVTVYAAMPLFGSAEATIENRKGIYTFPTEEPDAEEQDLIDILMSDELNEFED